MNINGVFQKHASVQNIIESKKYLHSMLVKSKSV